MPSDHVHPACLFCPAGPAAAARLQRRGLRRSSAEIRQTGPGSGRRRPVRRTQAHRNDAQGVHVGHRAVGQAQGGPEARLFQVRDMPSARFPGSLYVLSVVFSFCKKRSNMFTQYVNSKPPFL